MIDNKLNDRLKALDAREIGHFRDAAERVCANSSYCPCSATVVGAIVFLSAFRRAPRGREAGALRSYHWAFLLLFPGYVMLLAGCVVAPPAQQGNLCAVFDQYPEWYDDARAAQQRWGTPIQTQMAIVRIESAFHGDIRPPREWLLGFIPLPRSSSAYGYAQIQDPAWDDYKQANGGWFKGRTDMEDALDFIGWYTDKIHQSLGISKWDARRLYLAYHEGIAGYRSAAYRHNWRLLRTAARVERLARVYGTQLRRCESRFRCRHWYQFWPFCSA